VKARRHRTALRAIVAVRALQTLRAQGEVAGAAARLVAAEEQEKQAGRRLAAEEASWRGAVARAAFSPDLAGAWAQAVLTSQAALGTAAGDSVAAAERRDEAVGAWRRSLAACDVADALSERAARDWRRHRDETQLAQAQERGTGKGRT
jgi:hypothetical protein